MKFLSTLGLSLMFSALFATQAFAEDAIVTSAPSETTLTTEVSTETTSTTDEVETVDATTVTTEVVDGKGFAPCGCGYYGGISYDVNTTTQAKATEITINSNYYVSQAASKKEAVEELNAKFEAVKKTLDRYGKVTRTGISTYQNWQYTNTFDGNLSVRIDLSNMEYKETVENWLYDEGMDVWSDVRVNNLSEVEAAASRDLKVAMNQKESLYEDLLGYDLGKRTGISVWSWVDASTYDSSTGMVTVTTSVNVSFSPEQTM